MPSRDGSHASQLRHDGAFLRRLAYLGAAHGPMWWLRYSPPFFGLAAAALIPSARRAVRANLTRTRGEAGALRDAVDVGRTFATYAGCLAEALALGSRNFEHPKAEIHGDNHIKDALADGRGLIVVTAHTAGWEIVGPLLGHDHRLRVMLVMQAERDPDARRLHDRARQAVGMSVLHVGDEPLASLAILRHVKGGGAAALQVDRLVPGQRTRAVRLFDAPGHMPEGPLRLAQLTGAPIVPAFFARLGFRRYLIEVAPPVRLARRASEVELDGAAQTIANAMSRFLRAHPTQWFRFQE